MGAAAERGILAMLAAGSVLLAHALCPQDAAQRAQALYVGVLALGYGHLLGAAWLGWPRLRSLRPRTLPAPLFAVWLLGGGLAALAAYGWAAPRAPWLPLALLGVSVWHTVENDLALFRGGRLPHAAPPPLADPARRVLAVAWTAAFGVLVAATPSWREAFAPLLGAAGSLPLRVAAAVSALVAALRGDRGARLGAAGPGAIAVLPLPELALVDLFAAATLYHLYAWLGVLARHHGLLRRARLRAAARSLRRRLFAVHGLPAAACLVVAWGPLERLAELRPWLLGPGPYLLWSALHVVQTAWTRPPSPRLPGETP